MCWLWIVLNLVGIVWIGSSTLGGMIEEYRVKAAFFYHFVRFVTWPAEKFASSHDPFRICIIGRNPFQGSLQKALSGKTVHGRPFRLIRDPASAELNRCHVVFVGEISSDRSRKVLQSLRGKGVLTIGESTDFIQRGGIIRLFLSENKVRFGINPQAAQEANLEISSKLLRLAKIEQPS